MTKVEIFNHDGRIHGFSVSGHSGYAEEGSDIVCAAVSAAVTFVLTGFLLTVCSLRDNYPEYIEVMEV